MFEDVDDREIDGYVVGVDFDGFVVDEAFDLLVESFPLLYSLADMVT